MRVSKHTEEFRADAVAMCERGDRSIKKVAIDLGINQWTLRDWITRYAMEKKSKKGVREAAPEKESLAEKAKRLEREVKTRSSFVSSSGSPATRACRSGGSASTYWRSGTCGRT